MCLSPNLGVFAAPIPFSLSCPKVHPSSPLHSLFFCFSPHGSLFPASYPFNQSAFIPPTCLLYPHMPAGLFSHPQPSLLYTPHQHYFHRQNTQKCSVIVPMSAILLSLSTLKQACLSVSSERLRHCETRLG